MSRHYSKNELVKLLNSENADVVIDALMYLCFNVDDPAWILKQCRGAIDFGLNDDIRGLGITCVGHVARKYHEIADVAVIPLLKKTLEDPSLAGRARDALDDIEIFVK